MNFQAEHRQLQQILARELQDYGPHPLAPKDADAVAWHLADVTMQVITGAVERERAKRISDVTARLIASDKPTAKGRAWWRRATS